MCMLQRQSNKSPRLVKSTRRLPFSKEVFCAPFEKGGRRTFFVRRGDFGSFGFTLLEILIALFVFTILSMIMVAGLHSVTTSQAVTEARAARLTELQIALTILSRDFEQAVNRPITGINGLEPTFSGLPKTVIFTHGGLANPFGQLNRSTLQRTQYILEKNNLVRLTWPVLDHTMKVNPDKRVLLSDVNDVRFEFLDNKNNFIPRWPSTNQQQSALPKAIRVIITLRDSGQISQLYVIPVQTPDQQTPEKNSGQGRDITT